MLNRFLILLFLCAGPMLLASEPKDNANSKETSLIKLSDLTNVPLTPLEIEAERSIQALGRLTQDYVTFEAQHGLIVVDSGGLSKQKIEAIEKNNNQLCEFTTKVIMGHEDLMAQFKLIIEQSRHNNQYTADLEMLLATLNYNANKMKLKQQRIGVILKNNHLMAKLSNPETSLEARQEAVLQTLPLIAKELTIQLTALKLHLDFLQDEPERKVAVKNEVQHCIIIYGIMVEKLLWIEASRLDPNILLAESPYEAIKPKDLNEAHTFIQLARKVVNWITPENITRLCHQVDEKIQHSFSFDHRTKDSMTVVFKDFFSKRLLQAVTYQTDLEKAKNSNSRWHKFWAKHKGKVTNALLIGFITTPFVILLCFVIKQRRSQRRT